MGATIQDGGRRERKGLNIEYFEIIIIFYFYFIFILYIFFDFSFSFSCISWIMKRYMTVFT